jgi:GNAT superfamily N-acetyltransferase
MALPPGYTIHPGVPAVETYLHLRTSTGLTPPSAAQAAVSVQGAWYGCHIVYTPENQTSSETVAMGRIIGDGGWYFVITDMAVSKDHQRKGLGDAVLKHLLHKIKSTAPVEDGFPPYINLLADPPGRKLYERNGFVYTAPRSLGMVYKGDS